MKRAHPAISRCSKCGAAADEQCVSLRTGKPIKADHAGGRALVIPVVDVSALDPSKLPPPPVTPAQADQWAGDCTALFASVVNGTHPFTQLIRNNPHIRSNP